ncbi:hypothetical protein GCM10010136_21790 [Limoniibacter endophyticus]|uniref:Uncharacterized protein n=1 Tax=Limoniibacter endophyticus TaxID=1565040 RepID=A0A8J3DI25_9HYPH|nr:hypothetical protein GCM10010136_21790 [Limoniibacter endophyticus]
MVFSCALAGITKDAARRADARRVRFIENSGKAIFSKIENDFPAEEIEFGAFQSIFAIEFSM